MNMKKLSTVIRYECVTSIKYSFIFYLALSAVIAILYGIHYILTGILGGGMNCLEMNTMIFIGILGILQLTENFKMLIQNGFTRTYFFLGTLSLFAFISGFMSLVDTILANILHKLTGTYSTFFGSLYGYGQPVILSWFWLFLIYMLTCSLTFFFALVISNLSKKTAIISGVIFGTVLLAGVSFLFGPASSENFRNNILKFVIKGFGFMEDGSVRLVYPLSLIFLFAGILSICSYFIMRRTELKV